MLSRSVTRVQQQLLRPASRPATAVAAVAHSHSTSSACSFSTAVASSRIAARRMQPLTAHSRSSVLAFAGAQRQQQQRRLLSDHTREAIDRAVASAPVVLFMKGTPELPQCGFSRAAIQILGLQGVDPEKFSAFNVLEDPELRAGIKEYSDWPTIPQLYVDKEFVGGTDILIAMHQSGELAKLFDEKKVLIAAGEGKGEAAESAAAEAKKE